MATELTDHITHADTKQAVEQMYDEMSITAMTSRKSSLSRSADRTA